MSTNPKQDDLFPETLGHLYEPDQSAANDARGFNESSFSFRNRRNERYRSKRWRNLRWRILRTREPICEACGKRKPEARRIDVDHIKTWAEFPELAFDPANLQVLCDECHAAKTYADGLRLVRWIKHCPPDESEFGYLICPDR